MPVCGLIEILATARQLLVRTKDFALVISLERLQRRLFGEIQFIVLQAPNFERMAVLIADALCARIVRAISWQFRKMR